MTRAVGLIVCATVLGCSSGQESEPKETVRELPGKGSQPVVPRVEETESFEPTEAQRKAIEDALNAFPDFAKVGISVTELEVSGEWAYATIEPKAKGTAEGAAVLLLNDGGWSVLDYGTDLSGNGEEYCVPQKLVDRWKL